MITSSKKWLWQASKELVVYVLIFLAGWLIGTDQAIRFFQENPHKLPKPTNHTLNVVSNVVVGDVKFTP